MAHTPKSSLPKSSLLSAGLIGPACLGAVTKLDPRQMVKNPVMFVVEVVAAFTTLLFVRDLVTGGQDLGFTGQIILWLWFTVLFANFAEAVAEGRGKAQADSLRRTRTETTAKLLAGPAAAPGGPRTPYETVRVPGSRSATWCWSRPAT